MPQLDALVEECCLTPNDDAPRLVWADRAGGERGEFVVIQCALARGGLSPRQTGVLLRRERELILHHGEEWSGLAGFIYPGPQSWVNRVEFRRGFVEAIVLDPDTFVRNSEAISHRAPFLRSLTTQLWGAADLGSLRALLGSPPFGKLRGLHIVDEGQYLIHEEVDFDEVIQLLIESGALAQLDSLAFLGGRALSAKGARHLRASGELEHLEKLSLTACDAPEVAIEIIGGAPRLKALDLGDTDVEAVAGALPPVAALSITNTYSAIAALERSRAAATLEKLELRSGWLSLDSLGAFPNLRVLDLGVVGVFQPHEITVAMPMLRRLRVTACRDERGERPSDAIRPVARALGAQLELLELQGMDYDRSLLDELQSYVIGYVVGMRDWNSPLL
jgi:hypothetical protein